MRKSLYHRPLTATAIAALAIGLTAAGAAPVKRVTRTTSIVRIGTPPAGVQRPTTDVALSIGQGELINLPSNISNIWTSAPDVADVYVNNPHQLHLFGKGAGEATVFATSASGAVVYSANVRVSQNLGSIDQMMRAAMPDANIKVVTVGQIAVITGTVASPEDSAQAQRLVTTLLNPGVNASDPNAALKVNVINRLRTATPLQVNLQVRFAEVSKTFVKGIGVNLVNRDNGGGFMFGLSQSRGGSITTAPGTPPAGYINGAPVDANGVPIAVDANGAVPGDTIYKFPAALANGTTFGAAGRLLGMDLLGSLDAGERDGQVTTLATPNLSAISGETATFLAGGEIPIPISQGLGAVSVEYKQYGVSLAFTPTVLADGRISLRVRPEVSQLTSDGAVQINGTTIMALATRRVETTLEMGSGQSMMIAGLMQNAHNNVINKTPGVGDLPILGALFRSNSFQRNETELVVVITPYLVKPVNANDIVLPTDAYKAPTDLGRIFMGQLGGGTTGGDRPKPTMIAPPTAPAFGATAPVPMTPAPQQPARRSDAPAATTSPSTKKSAPAATPGFSF